MLGFETKAGMPFIDVVALAPDRAVKEVAGIKLQSGFGRRDCESASACRIDELSCIFQIAGGHIIQYEVVIETGCQLQLWMLG